MQRTLASNSTSPLQRTAFPTIIADHPEPIIEEERTQEPAKSSTWMFWIKIEPFERDILIASTCLKLLLFPA